MFDDASVAAVVAVVAAIVAAVVAVVSCGLSRQCSLLSPCQVAVLRVAFSWRLLKCATMTALHVQVGNNNNNCCCCSQCCCYRCCCWPRFVDWL